MPNPLLFLLFPIGFVGIWCLVLGIISRVSGWSTLAQHYRFSGKFEGQLKRFQSAKIKFAGFNNCLNIGISDDGFYLAPMVLFRIFHPPLLIPWGDIQTKRVKKFLVNAYELTFSAAPNVPVLLSERTFNQIVTSLEAAKAREATPVDP